MRYITYINNHLLTLYVAVSKSFCESERVSNCNDVIHICGIQATGGGDCSIRLWNMEGQEDNRRQVISRSLDPPQGSVAEASNDKRGEEFFPRIVKFLDSNTVLVMTNEG